MSEGAFDLQTAKKDTLAAALAKAATTATLTTGNFTAMTSDYLVIDYDVAAKIEVIKCTVSGTAVTSITRAQCGTADVAHDASAKVCYAFVSDHYKALTKTTYRQLGAAHDFDKTDLTTDGTWNSLDISSIVPANCEMVFVRVTVEDGTANLLFSLRKNSTGTLGGFAMYTQVANITHSASGSCGVDGQAIEYNAANTTWSSIYIDITGWVENASSSAL